ncbi:EGF-containing fibulin-like extracellular matrix protein 1,Fibrillin-1,Fibulin-1,Fibulin-5,Fibrillin-2 [Mytilus coruscus]|uniref:EGF-containing fibulin-like extracellular matrix protein 1,Fibrillin-1,Fibulin-1,Fibulin-5,Fibrillin-2 n=1 Tax=Mytilus coruscus TaxID=42192 RepID=A0A6J8EHF0_MYTCO|nr:EGF-containing fibulin-like extracellular matrix protein 1,Fibrillin-1,Fibulin-1,Fibulin-5,Fibrillin-2 [Mytilus coruscus]
MLYKVDEKYYFQISSTVTTYYRKCYTSHCCSGYTGSSCSQAICYGSTSCPNGGTCSLPDTCLCASGFDGLQCSDINECQLGTHNCQQLCSNKNGSFTCSCRTGYTLNIDQTTCTDIDECLYNNGGCSEYCRNVDGFYECYCQTGLHLGSDEKICIDIDECSSNIGGCEQVCENYYAGFRCECYPGFSIATDEKSCQDVDECLQSNKYTQSCNNTIGSYVCSCHPGSQLERDGFTCTDINECLLSNDTCDDECINTNGSFYCKCNSDSRFLSEDGVSCIAHVKDKSYKSIAIGLGTGISLAFLVVAVLFVVLKTRRKKPSIQNGTYNI